MIALNKDNPPRIDDADDTILEPTATPAKCKTPRKDRLRLSLGNVRVTLDLPSAEGAGPTMFDAGWLLFSNSEIGVMRLMSRGEPLSREQIATRLDLPSDGKLRGVLATLVSRKCLHISSDGYRITTPANKLRELREWLDKLDGGTDR